MCFVTVLLYVMACMVYVPLALHYEWTLVAARIVPCIIGWGVVGMSILFGLIEMIGKWLRPKLDAHHAERLSLLEQRIKDGKEGVCTIVEIV